jgi:arylsulfatase A-like enzyme
VTSDRPNVLWVLMDAVRRDALEPYGAPVGASPTVAQLAGRGHVLPLAYATASWTLPSHASMFSGVLPRSVGLCQSPGGTPFGAAPVVRGLRNRWLPEVLSAAGYRTGAVSCNYWASPATGFDPGFDEFVHVDTHRQASLDRKRLRSRARRAFEALRAKADDGTAEAGAALRAMFDGAGGQPRFWFVNVVESHSPYMPPRPWNSLSALGRVRAAGEAAKHLNLDAIWRACLGEFDIPDATLDRMRRLYADEVRYCDHWLAEVLESLDAAGRLDDTLVIVSSDHGENLGEGGLITHACSLDERLIHVPLIVAGPGAFTDAAPVSLADMPRRICQAVGIESPWEAADLPRDAAVAQFEPPVGRTDPRAIEMIQRWGAGDDVLERFTTPITCASDGSGKLVLRGAREEFYDLEADPLELSPLVPSAIADHRIAPLRAALEHPAAAASAAPIAATAAPDASEDEVARIERSMRLLGYM